MITIVKVYRPQIALIYSITQNIDHNMNVQPVIVKTFTW